MPLFMMMSFKLNNIVNSWDSGAIWEHSWTVILVNCTIEWIPSLDTLRFFISFYFSIFRSYSICLSIFLSNSHLSFMLVFNIIFLLILSIDEFVDTWNRWAIREYLRPIIVVISSIKLIPSFLVISSSSFRFFFSCNCGICSSEFFLISIIHIVLNFLFNLVSSHWVCTSLWMISDFNILIFGSLCVVIISSHLPNQIDCMGFSN